MDDIMDRISTLLTTRFGVPSGDFSRAALLMDLDLDSIAVVELGLVAEQEFGVRITEVDITPQDTVEALAGLIRSRRAAANGR